MFWKRKSNVKGLKSSLQSGGKRPPNQDGCFSKEMIGEKGKKKKTAGGTAGFPKEGSRGNPSQFAQWEKNASGN